MTESGPGATAISAPAPAYRFTGREDDEPLYLYYYRARYYHTDLQRFISEDPLRFSSVSLNAYVYVDNRPLRATDPLGLTQFDIDTAERIVRETYKHLKFPSKIEASLPADGPYLGEYLWLIDKMTLNEKYLKDLDDAAADELLDTMLHEVVHANDSVLKQIRDGFRRHPDVDKRAEELADPIRNRFQKERKPKSKSSG